MKFKILLVILLAVGAFLRFYRLEQFAMFLADQGRDAIIIKRIATLEHFTAIGPPTSIGQVFMGPFYYYFIAPWLLLFNFQPVGPAFGVAFFSVLYILINYLIVKDFIDKKTAIISSILIAFSITMIEFSRFSWNPNLLPLFAFLTYFFLIRGLKTKKWFLFALFGAFLSFSIQLHYLALFLIPPALLYIFVDLFAVKESVGEKIINLFIAFVFFIISISPLIIFDIRHGFINTQSLITLFENSNTVATDKFQNLLVTFNYLNQYVFNYRLSATFTNIILICLAFYAIFILAGKRKNFQMEPSVFLFFILGLVGISFYPGPKHAHYFGILFPFYFIILAVFISRLLRLKLTGYFLVVFLIGIFIFRNSRNYWFFTRNQQNQIRHAKKVALFLDKKINNQPFNFAVQPDAWQEDSYLYFLELYGKRPADRKKNEVSGQMFVVCGDPCDLYKTKSWNVTMFGQFKIVNEWPVDGVKIYKLVHKI